MRKLFRIIQEGESVCEQVFWIRIRFPWYFKASFFPFGGRWVIFSVSKAFNSQYRVPVAVGWEIKIGFFNFKQK